MDIKDIIIDDNITIREAIKILDKTAKRVLIITENDKLKGVITDGDIRRWILRNGDLSAKSKEITNYTPKYITETEKSQAKDLMKKYSINSIPVIGIKGEIKSIIFWDDVELEEENQEKTILNTPVVIMAGGLGTRLYPYTKILPKPLIPIGDIPIVERIINKFRAYGCSDYYLAVNYRKNMIKSYFGDIEKNYNISYLEEDKPLGTGGSLYLLKGKINRTFFVSNCDILIDGDYAAMYEYHKEKKNLITMICAVKNITIPYGVINLTDGGEINNMTEKPEYSFLTNTGVYIIEPEVLDLIEDDTFIHLPDIASKCMELGMRVGVYPITERAWMDMGQLDEMQEMINRLEGK
ncbi:nucleotidyltransferase family protein [Clostridium gasigenes]|uniref:Nucleotidyltransferase family protein n=1 Tax=Clostridium gasigenes TaxID=94869 RepID=A0A7X0VQS3_9CLOT|nr:nucleotidyltransferase family protein [Clostridium gasigenes]MBB6714599.1 nucleotidyltransferase family protein [Clostridium gasigenes]